MWCLWAALDIFLHGIFVVYLKVTCGILFIGENNDISVTIPIFGSLFSDVYRPLIYMCNVCMDVD